MGPDSIYRYIKNVTRLFLELDLREDNEKSLVMRKKIKDTLYDLEYDLGSKSLYINRSGYNFKKMIGCPLLIQCLNLSSIGEGKLFFF